MGTIYNHNITPDEVKKLRRMILRKFIDNRSEYEKSMSNDIKNADLYRLYSIRGQKKTAESYFEKIQDKILKHLLK